MDAKDIFRWRYPLKVSLEQMKTALFLEGIKRGADGQLHYFQPEVYSVEHPTWKEIDGHLYRFGKELPLSQTLVSLLLSSLILL